MMRATSSAVLERAPRAAGTAGVTLAAGEARLTLSKASSRAIPIALCSQSSSIRFGAVRLIDGMAALGREGLLVCQELGHERLYIVRKTPDASAQNAEDG